MCTCICVCVCVCVYLCVCVRARARMCLRVCVLMWACVCVKYMYIYMENVKSKHVDLEVCELDDLRDAHTQTYIQTHTSTHTYESERRGGKRAKLHRYTEEMYTHTWYVGMYVCLGMYVWVCMCEIRLSKYVCLTYTQYIQTYIHT